MISYKNVTIARGGNVLFEHLNFHVGEGKFVYLIGKVGTGKSSLIRTMYKDLDIKSGDEATIFGEFDLLHLRERQIPYLRRRVGIIFQDFQLLMDRSVGANLDFVLRATGWNKRAERKARISEVLELVGMQGYQNRMPNTLSGGEQQRVVIARALLNRPKLILADEPTANLDPETADHIVNLLYDICQQNKSTVIMTTHNLSYLTTYPGRALQVYHKELIEVGGNENVDTLESFIAHSTPEMLESLEGIPTSATHD